MEHYVILFSVILASTLASPPRISKQYRTDYVYNRKTDAFYKLHIESKLYFLAKEICTIEGAELMVPSSQQDIVQLHTMFKQYPDLGQYVWVGSDGQHHESAEEQPIIDLNPTTSRYSSQYFGDCEVVTRKGEIETYVCYHSLPFICKVEAKDAPYDSQCDVYGTDYVDASKNNSKVGSCYKISVAAYSWSQAYSECQAEGSHLVILNSEDEHNFVKEFMNTAKEVKHSSATWFFFAGVRAEKPTDDKPRVFKTIFNQTLDEAGYNQWSENEPNNFMNLEYCGSLFKNDGKYNDLACDEIYGFLCEKELHV